MAQKKDNLSWFLPVILTLMVLFSPSVALSQSPVDSDAGYAVAKSIAKLAQMGHIIDFHAVARELKLSDFEKDKTWTGPSSRLDSPIFTAVYKPPKSALEIVFVAISWNFQMGGVLNSLTIRINPANCPSLETVERAMGSKVNSYKAESPHGTDTHNVNTFTFPQSYGKPIYVYFNDVYCELEATR
ncbi:MAG: hypothetical protein K2Y28_00995 [Burkholderiaceae bacterium]|nr:hypothetical protein [Burkholderiaceae bacterium]